MAKDSKTQIGDATVDGAGKAEVDNAKQAIPLVIDPANMGFIRYIIKVLLPVQPKWVQVVVLFVFVALFAYVVTFTMQASIILPVRVQVALTPAEVKQKLDDGTFVEANSFKAPP